MISTKITKILHIITPSILVKQTRHVKIGIELACSVGNMFIA